MEQTSIVPDRYKHVAETSKEGRKLRITAKVRAAIDLMVWNGLKRDAAATKAGLKDNSLYVALARPDVKAYYLRQLDVLRTSERARNIHTLVEVRDQKTNQMARVQATKALEQISDEQAANTGFRGSPGMVVVVVGHPPLIGHDRPISPKPLIDHDPVHDGGS